MRYLFLLTLLIIFSGCESAAENESAADQLRVSAPAPQTLKQSVICVTTGSDGHLAAYSIEYTLDTYTDGAKIASCRTINNTTAGVVMNLKCPSNDPLAMTYSIIKQSPNNPNVFYIQLISETLDPTTSGCDETNY